MRERRSDTRWPLVFFIAWVLTTAGCGISDAVCGGGVVWFWQGVSPDSAGIVTLSDGSRRVTCCAGSRCREIGTMQEGRHG